MQHRFGTLFIYFPMFSETFSCCGWGMLWAHGRCLTPSGTKRVKPMICDTFLITIFYVIETMRLCRYRCIFSCTIFGRKANGYFVRYVVRSIAYLTTFARCNTYYKNVIFAVNLKKKNCWPFQCFQRFLLLFFLIRYTNFCDPFYDFYTFSLVFVYSINFP